MLLEFKTINFKSFLNEAVFSMTPAPKQKGLDYSILCESFTGGSANALCSSVVYGPNASGKTNIIEAMDVLRAIILRGNIKNSDDTNQPNASAFNLELIPNSSISTSKPVEFYIDFVENKIHFQYKIVLQLGNFLNKENAREIIEEEFIVNGNKIFKRDNSLSVFVENIPENFVNLYNSGELNTIESIANSSLQSDELFLCNGFKLVCSQSLYKIILNWFENKFMVICKADSLQLINRFSDPQKKTIHINVATQKAANLFGVESNLIGYIQKEDSSDPKLVSILKNTNGNPHIAIPADIYESYGTIRFINIFPLIVRAIMTGSTLIVDEFDASIHPMALMNIINIFHNDDINKHHAQLIFNTHNPIFLNSNILRRDEIKFVERDTNQQSSIYTLADFGTSGSAGVRKNEDYLKNYFISKYGAIKDIDFTPVFEEILRKNEENK